MSSTTGQAALSPSSPAVTNPAPPAATTLEPKMDTGLLALACSGSFRDLESFFNGTSAAIGSSAMQPPAMYAVTVGGDTLLHVVAASYGDSEDLLSKANLVYSKAPSLLFVQNSSGDTPLHRAARAGNIGMVSLLVGLANVQGINNAKGLLETQNNLKETALHEAVRIGSNDMVYLLMAHDPELATLPEEGTSPLYVAISWENNIIAKTLYELSGGVLSYSGPNGQNALHVAVQRSQDLTKMILEWKNDLTLQGDANRSTPLHFAIVAIQCQIKRDSQAICSQLLKANPNALYQPDHNGSFPIHVAASAGATWIINYFLMKSPNCAGLLDARGRTFLHVAVDSMKIETVDYACRNISLSWILNMQDKDGNTTLHLVVRKGSMRMFCSLFRNRQVQLNLMNEKGQTPLDVAHQSLPEGFQISGGNKAHMLKALKKAGAKRGIFHQGFLNEFDINEAKQKEIHFLNRVKEGTQSRSIISVLIATVTFGAMFAMPGGYRGDDHKHAGSPTLAGTSVFYVFIVADSLAFAFSTTAAISLMYSGDPTLRIRHRVLQFQTSTHAIMISTGSMTLAFVLATYAMLAPIAPVSGLAVIFTFIPLFAYHSWDGEISDFALFASFCRRKGICYGIFQAFSFAAPMVVYLIIFLWLALMVALTSYGGKMEALAQPPTPFT